MQRRSIDMSYTHVHNLLAEPSGSAREDDAAPDDERYVVSDKDDELPFFLPGEGEGSDSTDEQVRASAEASALLARSVHPNGTVSTMLDSVTAVVLATQRKLDQMGQSHY